MVGGAQQQKGQWRFTLVALPLAMLLTGAIIAALMFASRVTGEPEERVMVREISAALPPPPPPPPPEPREMNQVPEPELTIDQIGDQSGPGVKFSSRPKLADVTIDELEKPEIDPRLLQMQPDMVGDMRSFKVEELDEMPRIVNSRQSRIPDALRDRGINRVEAQVDILIDTRGQAYIRRIVDAGYPEMVPVIRAHIEAIEFTIPRKNGKPVNGEYLFTMRFKELL